MQPVQTATCMAKFPPSRQPGRGAAAWSCRRKVRDGRSDSRRGSVCTGVEFVCGFTLYLMFPCREGCSLGSGAVLGCSCPWFLRAGARVEHGSRLGCCAPAPVRCPLLPASCSGSGPNPASWVKNTYESGGELHANLLEPCTGLRGLQDQASCCGEAVLDRACGALPEAEGRCPERCWGALLWLLQAGALGGGVSGWDPPPGCATSPSRAPTPWQSPAGAHGFPITAARSPCPPQPTSSPPATLSGPGCVYQNRGEKLPSYVWSPNLGGTLSPPIR